MGIASPWLRQHQHSNNQRQEQDDDHEPDNRTLHLSNCGTNAIEERRRKARAVFRRCHVRSQASSLRLSFATGRAVAHMVRLHDYFVAAIDLRKSTRLYEKNASPIPATIAKFRHTASS